MSLKARITIDNSELKNGLKDAENQASKSMKNIKNATEQSGGAFSKFANKAQAAAKAVQGGVNGVVSSIGKLGPVGAVAAAAIAGIGLAVAGAFKYVGNLSSKLNDIGKAAKSVNMTANQYIALKYASSVAGVEMEKVLGIITKIDYALTHAEAGEKKYIDAFHALGLSWEQLQRLSPLQQMNAVADAWKRITSNGGPSVEVYDLFSRKDIQTFNKMAKEDFSKLTAQAGVLGLNLDEEQIRRMEAYVDSVQEAKDRFTKLNAEIDKAVGLSNMLKKTMEAVNDNLTDGFGFVNKEFKGQWESFGEVGSNMIKRQIYNNKNGQGDFFSTQEMKNLLKVLEPKINVSYAPTTVNPAMPSAPINYATAKYDEMTEAEIRSIFREKFERLDIERTDKEFRKALLEIVAKYDKRFNPKDKSTWTQLKEINTSLVTDPLQMAKESIEGEAKRISDELRLRSEQYEKISEKSGKIYDIEEKISDLNERIAAATKGQVTEIDKELQAQLRLNAAKANELALENEIKSLKKVNSSNVNSTLAQFISRTGGPDAGTMKQIIDTLEELGPRLFGEDYNFQKVFTEQLIRKYNAHPGVDKVGSLEEMLRGNPKAVQFAFEDLSKNLRAGIINNPGYLGDPNTEVLFKQLNEMIQNMNNAKSLEKMFSMLSERDDLLNDITVLQAQIAGNSGAERTASFKKYLKQRTGKFGASSESAADDTDLIHATMLQNLIDKKADLETTKEFKDKERDLKAQISLQYAEAHGLRVYNEKTMDDYRRLNVLREMGIKLTAENIKKWEGAAGAILRLQDNLENLQKVEAMNAKLASDTASLAMQKAQFSSDAKVIKQLEREKWLRENGLKVTKENLDLYRHQIDAAMKLNEVQKNYNVGRSLFDKGVSTHLDYLQRTGQGELAEIYSVLSELEKTKGSPLTEDQRELGIRYAKNSYWLKNATRPDIRDDVSYTNDLARKGGWNSSVAVKKYDVGSLLKDFENTFREKAQDNYRMLMQISNGLRN